MTGFEARARIALDFDWVYFSVIDRSVLQAVGDRGDAQAGVIGRLIQT